MIAIAILSIGASAVHLIEPYRQAILQVRATEDLAGVLDQELEALRARASRRCPASEMEPRHLPDESSWRGHALVSRHMRPGPGGTVLIEVIARVEKLGLERRMSALVRPRSP
ncbi:MAG: hypothetical protein HY791_13820 [Deltaproteobacteria bacterium]|nr:hypothetical protein [Deltaproteobacteria bacterium]